jgi:hypothetical protein
MAYQVVDDMIGAPALTDVSTTQKVPLGTIVKIADNSLAVPTAGEALYFKASGASIVAGSMVDYDSQLATGVLSPATAGTGPVGVAFATVPSGSFGWLQIAGKAAVKAPNAMVVGAEIWSLAATPGSVDDAVVAGEQILNAKASTTTGTPAAGLAYIEIDRPFHQGGIT